MNGTPPRARPLTAEELTSEGVWRSLLGRKVSLRYRLRDDPESGVSEAIGMVQSVGEDDRGRLCAVIVNRRGVERTVPIADVAAAKVFV